MAFDVSRACTIDFLWLVSHTRVPGTFNLHPYTHVQCLVSVVSKTSAKLNHCSDHVSLAYISNKPIIIVSVAPKKDILKFFDFGM